MTANVNEFADFFRRFPIAYRVPYTLSKPAGAYRARFGYVRFYDLRDNPAASSRTGQERLAGAGSGVPGSAVALIPTFSGSLLVLDVSSPRFPRLMTSFRPQGYSAWRVAAVHEYAYTDKDGNNALILLEGLIQAYYPEL